MIIYNVFDKKYFDMGFAAQRADLVPRQAYTLATWSKQLDADLVFNLAFFNTKGAADVKNRTLQYLRIPNVGECGYGGTEERLTLPSGHVVSGWHLGVVNGEVKNNYKDSKRSRNMLGILFDGRILQVQTDYKKGKAYTEKEVCAAAAEYARAKLGSRLSLLLVMDAGGSTGCYSRMSKLLFAPEKEGKDGRAVPSVFWVRRKDNAPMISRALYQGLLGEDVKILQSALSGVEIDGIYGPMTRARVIEAQKQLKLDPDGKAGPLTQRALGLR